MLDSKMGTSRPKLSEKPSPSRRKSIRQKRDRRKTSLMKKSFEYSKMCGADVCLGIRIRDTGRVYIFSADASGFWAFVASKLNCYYPPPSQFTDRDFGNSGDHEVPVAQQRTELKGFDLHGAACGDTAL